MNLVDPQEAMDHLRLGDCDMLWLAIWIPIVSESVRSYLKQDARLYLPQRDENGLIVRDEDGSPIPQETSGSPVVHPQVKAAVLLELASQYRFREGEGDNRGRPDEYGYALCRGAAAMLATLRAPTVA